MMMRFEWLFLRWVVIIAIAGIALRLAWSSHEAPARASQYRKVLLVQSSSSFGLPLAGIAVDPDRRQVFGLLGRPGKDVPADFFILWKGKDGSYGAAFPQSGNGPAELCEILPRGEARPVRGFHAAGREDAASDQAAGETTEMRSILQALPGDPDLPGR